MFRVAFTLGRGPSGVFIKCSECSARILPLISRSLKISQPHVSFGSCPAYGVLPFVQFHGISPYARVHWSSAVVHDKGRGEFWSFFSEASSSLKHRCSHTSWFISWTPPLCHDLCVLLGGPPPCAGTEKRLRLTVWVTAVCFIYLLSFGNDSPAASISF